MARRTIDRPDVPATFYMQLIARRHAPASRFGANCNGKITTAMNRVTPSLLILFCPLHYLPGRIHYRINLSVPGTRWGHSVVAGERPCGRNGYHDLYECRGPFHCRCPNIAIRGSLGLFAVPWRPLALLISNHEGMFARPFALRRTDWCR